MSSFLTAEEIIRSSSLFKLKKSIASISESGFVPLAQDWAEENRMIPPEVSPEWYGQFSIKDVPQYAELLACQHPDNPVTSTALMKSVQGAGTTSFMENVIGHWLKYMLGSVVVFTSSKGMAKMKSSSSIDPLIDFGGLAGNLSPISSRKASKKSGDTALYKEFLGGCKLLMTSYLSIGDMKSLAFNLLCMDEWDEAPHQLKGQGDVDKIINGRTMATKMSKRIYISTSTSMNTSRIYKKYTQGDQRQYYVPCPICEGFQVLTMRSSKRKYGLTFNTIIDPVLQTKVLDENSVRYTCQHCSGEFYDEQKMDITNNGQWRPTWKDSNFKPKSQNHRSYKSPGFISKYLNWSKICQEFIDTDYGRDYESSKTFTNNIYAEPHAHVDKEYSWKLLKERAESYRLGEPPENCGLLLYGGVDVQGDRLEYIVLGTRGGMSMETWVVDYRVFYGDTKNVFDSSWDSLASYVETTVYTIGKTRVKVTKCAVDSNWDPKMKTGKRNWQTKDHTVYQFVAMYPHKFIAIYGAKEKQSADIIKSVRIKNDNKANFSPLKVRYEIAVGKVKDIIFNNIDKSDGPGSIHVPKYERPEGGMDINIAIPDSFYKMMISESYQEISPGVYGWVKLFDRNEVLDITVYGKAAMYLDNIHTLSPEAVDMLENDIRNG